MTRSAAGRVVALATIGLTSALPLAARADAQQDPTSCIKQKMADGMSKANATRQCLEADAPSTTRPVSSVTVARESSSGSDSGGTSVGLVVGAVVLGAALGAGATLALRRNAGGTGTAVPAPTVLAPPPTNTPPTNTAPTPTPPTPTAPAPPGGDGRDHQRLALALALIDVADRSPSEALRADAVAALARAGIHPIVVPPGTRFDPTRMRGVDTADTPDPDRHDTVAGTERPGFTDGPHLIRPPDVVVLRHG